MRFHPTESIPVPHVDPTFARNPSDALQCLLDLAETSRQLKTLSNSHTELRVDLNLPFIGNSDDWHDWTGFLQTTPYFWTANTGALVTGASETYPLQSEAARNLREMAYQKSVGSLVTPPTYLPKIARAFCVFEKPTLFFTYHGRQEPLSAIGWLVGINRTSQEIWLSIRGISWHAGKAVPVWWSDGGSAELGDNSVDQTFSEERLRFTKWICTASMFVEQEILVNTQASLDRGVRRRAAKTHIEPMVHVVQLRREIAEQLSVTTGTPQSVDWSHRWLVRGHWRRQFFPSRESHAPVWIDPYIKGPEDKPFIESKPTVFSVSR